MSSAGQVVGGVVGGIIGFFAGGNVMLGASIGMAIGGAIDPPDGPNITGPRLSDTSQQTSTYGVAIPRTAGSCAVSGNVFWIENNSLKEVTTTEAAGGKGGGGAEITSYSYYGTFALGLAECSPGKRKSLGRIWIGGQLFYDPTSTGIESILATEDASQYFTFYSGADDQLPDERMQATLGIDVVPGYRGLCYIVFKDLPLADYMNTIVGTRIKVELFDATGVNHNQNLGSMLPTGNYTESPPTVILSGDKILISRLGQDYSANQVEIVNHELLIGSGNVLLTSRAPVVNYPDVFFGAHTMISVMQSDTRMCVLGRYNNGPSQYIAYGVDGAVFLDTGNISGAILPWVQQNAVYDKGELFLCADAVSSAVYKVEGGLHDLNWPGLPAAVIAGPVLSRTNKFGVSENFVFVVEDTNSTTSTTVLKLNRLDMTLAATYTQAASCNRVQISVVSDRVFYTCGAITSASSPIYKWVDGVVVDMDFDLQFNANLNPSPIERLISSSDRVHYLISTKYTPDPDIFAIFGSVSGTTTTLGQVVSDECLLSKLLTLSDINTSALTQEVRGYKVSSIGAIRAAIEPLRGGWPFDIVQSGYGIKFALRGGASLATITEDELDARVGGEAAGVRMTKTREMSLQIPRRVEVTYIDAAREYDIGPAGTSERLNTDAVNVMAIEMPVVLTADEAQGKAETLLYLYWLERYDLSFTLAPPHVNLEPADVITVAISGETLTVRLTNINYLPDGRLEVTAKLASSTIYSPNEYGQAGLSTGQVLTIDGASGVIPLDIPCIVDEMNTTGFPLAIYGERSGWPGGTAVRSWDAGQTWASVASVLPPTVTVAKAIYALPTGRTDIVDTINQLVLQPMLNTLSSVTELQMFAGANHFAVGADGRWEIIGAKTCTQQGDGSWVLTDLLRGRFGSEWACGLHQPLDTVVLLDSAKIPFTTMPLDRLFSPGVYRGVTNGAAIDSANDINFIYNGVNYECLSPVYINGGINAATKDWTVTWLRRTRVGGEWRDYVDAPLSETSELYEAEIWNSTFTQLKRTFSGLTSATFTWTAAQQITDFLVEQQTIYVKIFQISDKVGRGFPAQTSLTRALYVAPDPYWTSVSCLLHGDGSDGTNNFVDQTGKTVSIIGGTPTHETSSFKWGGSSIYFNATGGISVTRQAAFGFPADASIEFWINPDSNTVGSQVVYSSAANLSQKSIGLRIYRVTDTTWTPNLLLYPSTLAGTSGCITSGTWQFFQIIRSGNNVYFYRNGTGVGTFTYNAGDTYDTYCSIGAATDGSVVFKGYIDDFRITKGVARAAGTPTAAFPDA